MSWTESSGSNETGEIHDSVRYAKNIKTQLLKLHCKNEFEYSRPVIQVFDFFLLNFIDVLSWYKCLNIYVTISYLGFMQFETIES